MSCVRFRGILTLLLAAAVSACGSDQDKTRTSGNPPAADSARAATTPERPATPDAAAISIAFTSEGGGTPGEFIATLLVADTHGRHTGFDPTTGQTVEEIPGGWYGDETIEDPEEEGSGAATRTLEIVAPEPGPYTLVVQATLAGTYDLSIRGYNASLEPSGEQFSNVTIGAGQVHAYIINYDLASGVTVIR